MASNILTYPRDITMGPAAAMAIGSLASDTIDLPRGVRALWISGTGDIRVTLADMPDGDHVTYTIGSTGRWVGFVKRLWSTGTTATVQNLEF